MSERINKDSLLVNYPPEWPQDLRPEIHRLVQSSSQKVAVLDDDPTGTQTVHGVNVLTEWSADILQAELESDRPAFYLLTNSRALPAGEAETMNAEIGRLLTTASEACGQPFVVVSRSDSTLRGHFPAEIDALSGALGGCFDGWIVVPFFPEGGRYTLDDIHYVDEGGWLVPVGETAFARDSAFGFHSSNLTRWVEEKTAGRVLAKDVLSVSLDSIRHGGPAQVFRQLSDLTDGRVCVVNAVTSRDLEVFVMGLLEAEAQGKRFLYRTAASFVQVRAGLSARSLVTRDELELGGATGGLVAVGSYVPKTTRQVEVLLEQQGIVSAEIRVPDLLDKNRRNQEIDRVVLVTEDALQQGCDVVIYTSRKLVTVDDPQISLSIGSKVSSGLIEILRKVETRPRYLIAKGGITSSDVATKALNVKRAMVRGQVLPGVPIWELGPESRYPGMPYVVFPGNVGGPGAVAQVVESLRPPG
ncbi:MAG: hypothetical protein JXA42_03705 [Anaerolineales bacterium]|nr:hypothetical protein [Anaerolineales bacterium]